jgi:ribulose 1,5-bisphosphate carboxylase large subunit-like protein
LDLAKDDAMLSDQSFCRMIYRVEAVMSALEKVEKETDKQAFYAVNVAAGADRWIGQRRRLNIVRIWSWLTSSRLASPHWWSCPEM